MKNTFYITIILIAFSACSSMRGTGHHTQGSNILSPNEDGEYEITIIDSGYDRWFTTNARPVNFHSLEYYEQQNQHYVTAWNQRVGQQAYYDASNYPFETRIDYDPSIDYGLELNYKLFTYFQYIEDMYGTRYHFPL